jgi:Transposase
MATIVSCEPRRVVGGVDTHKDVHVAAVIDAVGRSLASESFPTTRHGYRCLLRWLRAHGELVAVGVEGTGSWGAGLARYLTTRGVAVMEVNRPNRQNRRLRGKSDAVDAEAAARAVLNRQATVTPSPGPDRWRRSASCESPAQGHEGPHGGRQPAAQPLRHGPRPSPGAAGPADAHQEGGRRRTLAARFDHDGRHSGQASPHHRGSPMASPR